MVLKKCLGVSISCSLLPKLDWYCKGIPKISSSPFVTKERCMTVTQHGQWGGNLAQNFTLFVYCTTTRCLGHE